MPTLTLKSLPDELYHQQKARAAAHHRSVNSEILVRLEQAVAAAAADAPATLGPGSTHCARACACRP